tara:strand:+ start:188 stop:637 length:450 start_codon:yes stop_codon:yes gene_type:complete
MNIKLERSIIKPKRNYRGNIVQPSWFTKYGRYLKEHNWNNIIVYRPYKVKVTEYNAERLFSRLVKKNDLGIEYLWYALEKDRDTNWTHAHLLTNGICDLNKIDIASALKRSISEIKYLSTPKNKEAVSHYCSKHIGIGHITGYGFVHKY